jgi:uncharacterized iron-regulated membrane protein
MKEHFRQSMAWLHTWVGLVAGWLMFFIFLTGTAGYFNSEIGRWMRPELPLANAAPAPSPAQGLALAERHLQAVGAQAMTWDINLPGGRGAQDLSVSWRDAAEPGQRAGRLHQATLAADGSVVPETQARATGGGRLLYRMHVQLHYMHYETGYRIVGAVSMVMLLAIITGIIVHKKIFADFFTFRPGKGQRSWLDAHNLISVAALPFFLMITYSGLLFFQGRYMPLGFYDIGRSAQQQAVETEDDGQARAAPAAGLEQTPVEALHPLVPLLERAEAQWAGARWPRCRCVARQTKTRW